MRKLLIVMAIMMLTLPASAMAGTIDSGLKPICIQLTLANGATMPVYHLFFSSVYEDGDTGREVYSVHGFSIHQVDETSAQNTLIDGTAFVFGSEMEVSLYTMDISHRSGDDRMDAADVHLLLDPATMNGTFTAVETETADTTEQTVYHWTGTVTQVTCPD